MNEAQDSNSAPREASSYSWYVLSVLVSSAGRRPFIESGVRSRTDSDAMDSIRRVVLNVAPLEERSVMQDWRVVVGVLERAAVACKRYADDFGARHAKRERGIDYALKCESLPPDEAIRVQWDDYGTRLPEVVGGAPSEVIELRHAAPPGTLVYWSEARQRLFFYGDEHVARNWVRSGLAT